MKQLQLIRDTTQVNNIKKNWQEPDFYIIDSNNINGGPVNAVQEQTVPSITATNHS